MENMNFSLNDNVSFVILNSKATSYDFLPTGKKENVKGISYKCDCSIGGAFITLKTTEDVFNKFKDSSNLEVIPTLNLNIFKGIVSVKLVDFIQK